MVAIVVVDYNFKSLAICEWKKLSKVSMYVLYSWFSSKWLIVFNFIVAQPTWWASQVLLLDSLRKLYFQDFLWLPSLTGIGCLHIFSFPFNPMRFLDHVLFFSPFSIHFIYYNKILLKNLQLALKVRLFHFELDIHWLGNWTENVSTTLILERRRNWLGCIVLASC